MLNPQLHLWRAVLLQALRDKDADRWLRTPDSTTVCALAGLDHEAVRRAWQAGRVAPAIRPKAKAREAA